MMKENIEFAKWVLVNTKENPLSVFKTERIYLGKVYTVSELYPIYLNWTTGL